MKGDGGFYSSVHACLSHCATAAAAIAMHRLHCSPTMIIHGVGGGRSIVDPMHVGGYVYCRLHLALPGPGSVCSGRILLPGVWKTRCTLEKGCAHVQIPPWQGSHWSIEEAVSPPLLRSPWQASVPLHSKLRGGICSSAATQEEEPATKGREPGMEPESLRES